MTARRGPALLVVLVLAAVSCLVGGTGPPAAAVAGSAAPSAVGRWVSPTGEPIQVVRAFAPPVQRWLPGHRGVDLAAAPGAVIVAAGPGVVSYAGMLAGRGVVTVTHGTLRTTYEPVHATVLIGDRVAAGQQIGTLGSGPGHCPSAGCLHWGLLRGDIYLNPLSLLRRGPSRLLPVWPGRSG
jgi:murein DD-endopeptidase MepM/ murein hydrolase activator NlpD